MKKRFIWFTVLFALILIVAGISGAWYSYYKISTDVKIQHQISSTHFTEKELTNVNLKLTGGASVIVEPSPDNQFHLYERSFRKHPKISTWSFAKEDSALTVNVQHATRKKLRYVPFIPFRIHDLEQTILQVPKNVHHLTLTSNRISTEINDLDLDSLTLDGASGATVFHSLRASTLELNTTKGSITLDGSKISDTFAFKSTSGNLDASDTQLGTFKAFTHSGSINLLNVTGTAEIETMSGAISLQDSDMRTTAKATSGEISISNDSLTKDVDFETTSGYISIYATNYSKNLSIKTDAPADSSYIFNEDRSSYEKGNGKGLTITAKTSGGYITVDH